MEPGMETISRTYESYGQARAAVGALEEAGVPSANISLVANKYVSVEHAAGDDLSESATGAGLGGAVGGGAGLLAGVGLLAIPGLGPVVAAGWLASTALGVVAGAATGGLVGALIDAGEDAHHAHIHSETVRRGGTLLTVRVPDGEGERVARILAAFRPIDPVERSATYRAEGWRGFDPSAAPYRPTQAEIERMRRGWSS